MAKTTDEDGAPLSLLAPLLTTPAKETRLLLLFPLLLPLRREERTEGEGSSPSKEPGLFTAATAAMASRWPPLVCCCCCCC